MRHVQKSIPGWLKASAVFAGLTLVTAICVTRGVKKQTVSLSPVLISGLCLFGTRKD